jgi:hypothetical protein
VTGPLDSMCYDDGQVRPLVGGAGEVLAAVLDRSVDRIVTSPPAHGLRGYGTGRWVGGSPDCRHPAAASTSRRRSTLASATRRPRTGAATHAHAPMPRPPRRDGRLHGPAATPGRLRRAPVRGVGRAGARRGRRGVVGPWRLLPPRHRPRADQPEPTQRRRPARPPPLPGPAGEEPAGVCRGGSPSPSKPDGWILGSAVVWPKPTPCPTAWCRPPARCEPALRPTA